MVNIRNPIIRALPLSLDSQKILFLFYIMENEEYIYALVPKRIDVAGLITDLQLFVNNLEVDSSRNDTASYARYIELQNKYLEDIFKILILFIKKLFLEQSRMQIPTRKDLRKKN